MGSGALDSAAGADLDPIAHDSRTVLAMANNLDSMGNERMTVFMVMTGACGKRAESSSLVCESNESLGHGFPQSPITGLMTGDLGFAVDGPVHAQHSFPSRSETPLTQNRTVQMC